MDVNLDTAYWLGLAISFVLPVLVGLVTSANIPAGVKAVLHLFLAAVLSFLTEWSTAPDGFDFGTALVLTAVSFVIGVAAHFGFYKPTTISAKVQSAFTTAA